MVGKYGKVYLDRNLTQGNLLRTTGRIISGPYSFWVSRPERSGNTSLEEILIGDTNESVGGGNKGIEPESSKVRLGAKICKKFSFLAWEVIAILPSGSKRGRKLKR